MSYTYWYDVEDDGSPVKYTSDTCYTDFESLLKEAALHCWDHADGWQSSWPMNFKVFSSVSQEVLLCEGMVYMESRPYFTVRANHPGDKS